MAQDPELIERMRDALGPLPGLTEKRMMGGICFLINGNMIGGADRAKDGTRRFMFRVGKANIDRAAGLRGGTPMVMGERSMPGFYFVDAAQCDRALLNSWVGLALEYARCLPPK